MWILVVIGTLIFLAVTLLPLWRNSHWSVRGLEFPRLQIACLGILLLILMFCLVEMSLFIWALALIAAGCVMWHLRWVLPYTCLWRKEVKEALINDPQRSLTVLTANVLQTNRDAEKLLELVRQHQPDILVTLESNQRWQDQLSPLEKDMPYCLQCPLENLYGMHVYSCLPLKDAEICFLVEDSVPSMHAEIILPSGDSVRAHFIHPAPPSPTENPESSERDAELVIVARSVAESQQPTIVTGDLNDVAWSATTRLFRKISGLIDPRIGRGMFNTFHVNYPFLRWPLDHLFHSEHFSLRHIQRLPSIGSDHFPLLTSLALRPHRDDNDDGISSDQDERDWASDIADTENVEKRDVPQPGE